MQRSHAGGCQHKKIIMHFLRYLVPAIIFILVLAGCKQEGASNEGAMADGSIYGTWELHHTFGGMMPPATYGPGNGNLLRIDSTTYQMIRGGQTVQSGTYRLATDSFMDVNSCVLLPPKSTEPNWIVADSINGLKTYYEINGDTLKLTAGCIPADGGVTLYKRTSGRQ